MKTACEVSGGPTRIALARWCIDKPAATMNTNIVESANGDGIFTHHDNRIVMDIERDEVALALYIFESARL